MDPSQALALLGIGTLGQGAPAPTAPAPAPGDVPVTSPDQVPDPGPANTTLDPEDNPVPAATLQTDVQRYAAALRGTPSSPQSPPGAPAPSGSAPLPSVAAGGSVSASGYSPGSMAAIQGGARPALEKRMSAGQAAIEARNAPIQEEFRSAAEMAKQAAAETAVLESRKMAVMAEGRGHIATANAEYYEKEKGAYERERADTQAAFDQYKAAQAQFAAMKVNPNDLWDSAGSSGQAGMIVTAFMHDFLGAKGIKTSGLDMINGAIKANIDAQLANMKHAGEAAEGFRTIWEMTRAQSKTDAEARAKVHGFLLQSLSDATAAEAGKYDSPLALAKGKAMVAAIAQEQAKNDLEVRKHIDQARAAERASEVAAYGHELAASTSKYAADAHLKAALIGAATKQGKQGMVLYDVSESGKGAATRRLDPNLPPETQAKLLAADAGTKHLTQAIFKLQDLQRKIASRPPDLGIAALKSMQNEEQRLAEQVRKYVQMTVIYENSGKAINEQEIKTYDQMFAKKDWWTNGDNVRQLATYAGLIMDKQGKQVQAVSLPLTPDDPAYGTASAPDTSDPGNRARAEVESAERSKAPGERDYLAWSLAPNAKAAVAVDSLPKEERPFIEKAWGQFLSTHPSHLGATAANRAHNPGDLGMSGVSQQAVAADAANPDRAFVNIARLADLAYGTGDEQAKSDLFALATSHDKATHDYAVWFRNLSEQY